jgi:hypothetical protein
LGDPFGALVDPARGAPEVEHPWRRSGEALDDAGLDVLGRQVDEHAVDVRKAPQREPLVLDAVLRADQPELIQAERGELLECAGGVLGLHRQHDRILCGELGRGRRADGRDRQTRLAFRVLEAKPIAL